MFFAQGLFERHVHRFVRLNPLLGKLLGFWLPLEELLFTFRLLLGIFAFLEELVGDTAKV